MKKIIGISLVAIAGVGAGIYMAVNSSPKLKSKITKAASALKFIIDDAKLSAEQKASDRSYMKFASKLDEDCSQFFDGCSSRCHLSDEDSERCQAVDCDGCSNYYCNCYNCDFKDYCSASSSIANSDDESSQSYSSSHMNLSELINDEDDVSTDEESKEDLDMEIKKAVVKAKALADKQAKKNN